MRNKNKIFGCKNCILIVMRCQVIMKFWCLIVTILICNKNIVRSQLKPVIVETKTGKLAGEILKSENGREFFSFKKIPYGKPPIGKLRFQDPEPVEPWNVVYNSTSYPTPCAQAALGYNEGVEDCLYLSVFTPQVGTKEEERIPVLVWLHGGAFVTGSSEQYNPTLMMNKNVILVIPQYRLGILGYFSTRSKFAYGNYGTMDQIMALKWVQNNIERFGGDPGAVTLAGDCGGGASAIFHMISPVSKGLFHRVISLSGSPLVPWAIHPNANRLSLMMAKHLICPHHDFEFLTDCFQKRDLSELMDSQQMFLESRDMLVGNHRLSPAIQKAVLIPKAKKVLPQHPLQHLLTGDYTHVPVLLSVTRDVGAYIIDMSIYDFLLQQMEENPGYLNGFIKILLPELGLYNPELEVSRFVKYYLGDWDRKTLNSLLPGLSKLLGDALYNAGIFNLAKILSVENDVWMLRFDYEKGPKLFDIRNANASLAPPMPRSIVSHGDELFSIFPEDPNALDRSQLSVAREMIDIVENFVYGRKPHHEWSTFKNADLKTSIINKDGNFEPNSQFSVDEEMLNYIYQSQHFEILKDLIKQQNLNIKLLVKDEL